MRYKLIKPILTSILIVVFANFVNAQDANAPVADAQDEDSGGLSGGVKILTNVNTFQKTSPAMGYGVGGFVNYELMGFLTLRGEALYVSYASGLDSYVVEYPESSSIDKISYDNVNLRFHSLEFPVLAQITLPFMENLKPKVFVGGSYTYNFGVFEISDNTFYTTNINGAQVTNEYTNSSENVSSSYLPYNTSVIGGLQVSFDDITVDLRYQQGIPNLNTSNNTNSLGDMKSRTLSLSIGYKLF